MTRDKVPSADLEHARGVHDGWGRHRGSVAVATALALFASVAAGCSTAGQAANGGSTPATLSVAVVPPFSITCWPLLIAKKEGFFARQHLNVNLVYTFNGNTLLGTGKVEILQDGADAGLSLLPHFPLVYLAPIATHVTDGLYAPTSVPSLRALAGKTFGTQGPYSTDEFVAVNYMRLHGFPNATTLVHWTTVGSDAAAFAEVEANKLGGATTDQGYIYQIQHTPSLSAKVRVLATPAQLPPYPWNVAQASKVWAAGHSSEVVGYIRAVQQAMHFIVDPANKSKVIKDVVALGQGLLPSTVTNTYDAARFYHWVQYQFSPLTASNLQPALSWLKWSSIGTKTKAPHVDLASLIDGHYFAKAVG